MASPPSPKSSRSKRPRAGASSKPSNKATTKAPNKATKKGPAKGSKRPKSAGRKKAAATSKRAQPGAKAKSKPAEEGPSENEIGLPYLINVVANYVNESMREDLSRAGMTVPRWTVLAALRDEDGQSIGDLSRSCLIRQSSLTRVVDQLERDGHVERVPAADDHRVVEVWLTEVGNALYQETVPDVVERASGAVRQLVANEVDQLADVLGRARDSLRSENPPQEKKPKRTTRSAKPRKKSTQRGK